MDCCGVAVPSSQDVTDDADEDDMRGWKNPCFTPEFVSFHPVGNRKIIGESRARIERHQYGDAGLGAKSVRALAVDAVSKPVYKTEEGNP